MEIEEKNEIKNATFYLIFFLFLYVWLSLLSKRDEIWISNQWEREKKRERFSRFSENSSRFSEKSFRLPRIVFWEQIFRLKIWEEKNIITRLVLGNGNGKTMVFNMYLPSTFLIYSQISFFTIVCLFFCKSFSQIIFIPITTNIQISIFFLI